LGLGCIKLYPNQPNGPALPIEKSILECSNKIFGSKMLNNPFSIGFILLGLIMITGGIIWISKLSHSEGDDEKTTDNGERLINVGFGEYDTEGLVVFRIIAAIIIGIILVVAGFLI
jgi:vacuolar-type H+-ATPase subunit I/STV1